MVTENQKKTTRNEIQFLQSGLDAYRNKFKGRTNTSGALFDLIEQLTRLSESLGVHFKSEVSLNDMSYLVGLQSQLIYDIVAKMKHSKSHEPTQKEKHVESICSLCQRHLRDAQLKQMKVDIASDVHSYSSFAQRLLANMDEQMGKSLFTVEQNLHFEQNMKKALENQQLVMQACNFEVTRYIETLESAIKKANSVTSQGLDISEPVKYDEQTAENIKKEFKHKILDRFQIKLPVWIKKLLEKLLEIISMQKLANLQHLGTQTQHYESEAQALAQENCRNLTRQLETKTSAIKSLAYRVQVAENERNIFKEKYQQQLKLHYGAVTNFKEELERRCKENKESEFKTIQNIQGESSEEFVDNSVNAILSINATMQDGVQEDDQSYNLNSKKKRKLKKIANFAVNLVTRYQPDSSKNKTHQKDHSDVLDQVKTAKSVTEKLQKLNQSNDKIESSIKEIIPQSHKQLKDLSKPSAEVKNGIQKMRKVQPSRIEPSKNTSSMPSRQNAFAATSSPRQQQQQQFQQRVGEALNSSSNEAIDLFKRSPSDFSITESIKGRTNIVNNTFRKDYEEGYDRPKEGESFITEAVAAAETIKKVKETMNRAKESMIEKTIGKKVKLPLIKLKQVQFKNGQAVATTKHRRQKSEGPNPLPSHQFEDYEGIKEQQSGSHKIRHQQNILTSRTNQNNNHVDANHLASGQDVLQELRGIKYPTYHELTRSKMNNPNRLNEDGHIGASEAYRKLVQLSYVPSAVNEQFFLKALGFIFSSNHMEQLRSTLLSIPTSSRKHSIGTDHCQTGQTLNKKQPQFGSLEHSPLLGLGGHAQSNSQVRCSSMQEQSTLSTVQKVFFEKDLVELFFTKKTSLKYEQSMRKNTHKYKQLPQLLSEQCCTEAFETLTNLKGVNQSAYWDVCQFLMHPFSTVEGGLFMLDAIKLPNYTMFCAYLQRLAWLHRKCPVQDKRGICSHIGQFLLKVQRLLTGTIAQKISPQQKELVV